MPLVFAYFGVFLVSLQQGVLGCRLDHQEKKENKADMHVVREGGNYLTRQMYESTKPPPLREQLIF